MREPPNEFRFLGTVTGAYVAFNNGSSITAGAASATYRLPSAGTFLASYTRIDSQDVEGHQGDHFTLRSNELRLTYSHLLERWIARGGSVRLSESRLSMSSLFFDDFPLHTSTESLGVEGSIGVLVAPHKNWLVGIFVALGWTRGETTGFVDFPPEPFGPGLTPIDFTDNTRSVNIRGGLGWRPSDKFSAYADWQYLRLKNVRIGSSDDRVDVRRMFAGVEYLPFQILALRVGGSADTDRQFTLSTGVGLYPTNSRRSWRTSTTRSRKSEKSSAAPTWSASCSRSSSSSFQGFEVNHDGSRLPRDERASRAFDPRDARA